MPLVTIEGGRMYYPSEDDNNPDDRKVMHPETDSSQVLMADGQTLESALAGGLVISDTQPEQACIWGKIVKTDNDDEV